MPNKIDWSKVEESNVLVHKEGQIFQIKFLNEGMSEMTEIKDKKTGKTKDVEKYFWKVMDLSDNSEREYSTLSSRLLNQLKPYVPLKNKAFQINKFRIGTTEFDIDFRVIEIK